jgi:hypothetical protein
MIASDAHSIGFGKARLSPRFLNAVGEEGGDVGGVGREKSYNVSPKGPAYDNYIMPTTDGYRRSTSTKGIIQQ